MKKDIAGLFNLRDGIAGFSKCACGIAGRDFFLKNGAGERDLRDGIPPARSPSLNVIKKVFVVINKQIQNHN